MSKTTDPDKFFQTTDSIATTRRKALKSKNNHGNPIRLPSKILALIPDPTSQNHVYGAEAAGTIRRVALEAPYKHTLFTGPTAPLTSLTLSPPSKHAIYAGCWDKTIWSWSTTTRAPGLRFRGHTDFVKCVLYVCLPSGLEVLISGSADTTVIIWDVETGNKLHKLKAHTRGVQALAVDPYSHIPTSDSPSSSPTESKTEDEEQLTLFTADSLGLINRWSLSPTFSTPPLLDPHPLTQHSTSITSLVFDPMSTDLHTSSLDRTALTLSRSSAFTLATDTFTSPDYVRCIALSADGKWVITGGRDEGVRVWDRGTGEQWGTWEGHWDEVMGVICLDRGRVVSAGIDGTVRVWRLGGEEMEAIRGRVGDGREGGAWEEEQVEGEEEKEDEGKEVGMTDDEERELAELMDEE